MRLLRERRDVELAADGDNGVIAHGTSECFPTLLPADALEGA